MAENYKDNLRDKCNRRDELCALEEWREKEDLENYLKKVGPVQ
jgi:hypothetical protein